MTFAAVRGGVRKGRGSGEGGGWKETAVNFATLLSLFFSLFLSLSLSSYMGISEEPSSRFLPKVSATLNPRPLLRWRQLNSAYIFQW